jgi:hypothetical protein
VLEADRLRPRPFGGADIGVGEFFRALPGETGFERMIRRPPDLGRESVAARAEGVDDRRKQQRLADRDILGLKPCCAACDQKVAKSGGIMLPVTISALTALNAEICDVKSLFMS